MTKRINKEIKMEPSLVEPSRAKLEIDQLAPEERELAIASEENFVRIFLQICLNDFKEINADFSAAVASYERKKAGFLPHILSPKEAEGLETEAETDFKKSIKKVCKFLYSWRQKAFAQEGKIKYSTKNKETLYILFTSLNAALQEIKTPNDLEFKALGITHYLEHLEAFLEKHI